jgi:uncharacterized membrane protein
MSISINTHFVPYKLDLKERKPVQLDVEIINRYSTQKKIVLEVLAGNQIGLNKTGSQKEKFELGLLHPGENRTIKLDVIPKNFAMKGEENILITATEITVEETGYSYPTKKFKKNISIELK